MTCVACARGTYQNEVGQKGTCKDSQCCKGTYASAVANGATHEKDGCLKCAAGKYQSETGKAQACIDCLAGQFSDLVGASACKTGYCALGKYMTATGQSDPSTMCIACAVGTYKDSTVASYSAAGTTSCKNARCNSGFSIAATGQTTGDVACAACGTATGDIGTVNTHAIGGTDQCKACLKVQVDGGTATAATATAIAVTESTQVNSAPNTIEVRFRVTGRIYPGTQVEISGFNDHSETTDNTALPISGASAATYGSTGDWKQNTGKLTLTVATIANVTKDSVAEQNAVACAAATTEAACTAVGTNLRNYGTGAPYNTAANQVYKGAKCQWTVGTTTCSPVSGYADAQLFPWGWYPTYADDFPLQTVQFTINNPTHYAGRREITVRVMKDLSQETRYVGAVGTDYPYVSTSSTGQRIFSGTPTVSGLAISDTVAGGAAKTFNQVRSINLDFTIELAEPNAVTKVAIGTSFTIDNIFTSNTNTDIPVTGTGAAIFGSTATLNRCQRTMTFTTTQEITVDTTFDLDFDLTSVGYVHNAANTAITFSASTYHASHAGDIIPATPVTGDALSTSAVDITVQPTRFVTTTPNTLTVSGLVGGETLQIFSYSAAGCGAVTGSPSSGSTVALSVSTLAPGSYMTCVLPPNENCPGSAGSAKAPQSGRFTVVPVPTLVTNQFTVPISSGTTLDLTVAAGQTVIGDYLGVSSDYLCTRSYFQQDAGDRASPRQITAGTGIAMPTQLTLSNLYVCYATQESYAMSPANFKTLGLITLGGSSVTTLAAASSVAPTGEWSIWFCFVSSVVVCVMAP
jgi:hypothetical protein